jgi:hypothetical protein
MPDLLQVMDTRMKLYGKEEETPLSGLISALAKKTASPSVVSKRILEKCSDMLRDMRDKAAVGGCTMEENKEAWEQACDALCAALRPIQAATQKMPGRSR